MIFENMFILWRICFCSHRGAPVHMSLHTWIQSLRHVKSKYIRLKLMRDTSNSHARSLFGACAFTWANTVQEFYKPITYKNSTDRSLTRTLITIDSSGMLLKWSVSFKSRDRVKRESLLKKQTNQNVFFPPRSHLYKWHKDGIAFRLGKIATTYTL